MNILIVTPFDVAAIGGVSGAVRMLARHFALLGHKVHILMQGENNLLREKTDSGFAIHTLYLRPPMYEAWPYRSIAKCLAMLPITLWQLSHLCTSQRVDVVYVQYPVPHFFYFGLLRRMARWTLIATFQGSDAHRIGQWGGLNRRCLEYLLRSADHVTGVARSLLDKAQDAVEFANTQKSVIPNGANIHEPGRCDSNSDRMLPGCFILSVGHLIRRKGFDVLIRAFALAHARNPQVELVIAGDGMERDRLLQLASQCNVDRVVHFLGWRDHQQTLDLMRRCFIFALSSRAEGLPLVVVEAMMSAKAVVATAVDGVPDIVLDQETGLLVQPDNPIELSEAIQRLITDDSLRMGLERAAYERARHHYDWASIAQQYLRLASTG